MKRSSFSGLRNRAGLFVIVFLLVSLLVVAQNPVLPTGPAKRPVAHKDYDSWRSLSSQKLSNDGRFVAYLMMPTEGDGELVVRNLATGVEIRQVIGSRPGQVGTPGSEASGGGGGAAPSVVSLAFSADSKSLVFTLLPTKAERDKAKKDKKMKPEDKPKNALAIMDLATGNVVRIPKIKSFQLPEEGNDWLAYLKDTEQPKDTGNKPASEGVKAAEPGAKSEAAAPGVSVKPEPSKVGNAEGGKPEQQAAGGTKPSGSPAKKDEKKKELGSELVLRKLSDGTERVFRDVMEYTLTKDASTLVYKVASTNENDGFYVVSVQSGENRPLLTGKGKYTKLVWDEKQTQAAFLSDKDDAKSKQPKFKLYKWERQDTAPVEIVSVDTPGFKKEYVLSDKASVSFSKDGRRLFLGCSTVPPPEKEKDKDKDADSNASDEGRATVDLWHWKDDHIQPMQKTRASADKNRSFQAVYHVPEKKFVQLGEKDLTDFSFSEDGLWAIATDDHQYRAMAEYDQQYADWYLVNTLTGERKLLEKKLPGRSSWSPDGKYVAFFNGKDWNTIALPSGTATNLTGKLGVNFWDEENDTPGTPPAYGIAGWTKDGKYILLYDRYDVWQLTPDGKSAKNITDGAGRKQELQFRYTKLRSDDDDSDQKWIDASKPLLLKAENRQTRDSGFYRDRINGTELPHKLIMAAKKFGQPTKAKNADVVLLTVSAFNQFPDLNVTDPDFRKLQKVSNGDAQRAEYLWGTAELVQYRNVDGVPLKGILYKPENFNPAKKYPMVVYIYERLSQNLHNFVTPGPGTNINPLYYVSNGYLVFEPDIVYTVGKPGQSALKCVLPAIDAVVAKGFVNEKAIGIQGHSWGGYQIAYMVTQTTRFRAVAAGAPVSNMTSAYDGIRWGTGIPRQFQYERTQSRIGGTLWQYPTRFIENSPVFMADRVKTPIMILHNDGDDAVPWYQGIEYYLALRRLGKEVYMFNYNGEPHGLKKRVNQKDYTVRMQQFFDYFLKGAPKPEWMEKGIPFLERDEEKDRLKAQIEGTTPKTVGSGSGSSKATASNPATAQ